MILPIAGMQASQQPFTRGEFMPSITRQVPPKPVQKAPTFANGSLLSSAVPVSTLQEERVKVCIYGRNRSGKTTLASMFPKPILFVSCEPAHCGGVQSVSNVEGASVIMVELKPLPGEKIAGRNKVIAIGEELAKVKHFQTVVLKTATSLQDIVMQEMNIEFPGIPWSGKGSKDTYGMRSARLIESIRPMLDLKHLNVVILAQEKDHNPPKSEDGFPDLKAKILHTMQQGSFMAPSLGAGPASWLQDACGYVLQIYEDEVMARVSVPMFDPQGKPMPPAVQLVGTGKRQRHVRLKYHPNFAAGGKWNFDPDLPEAVTAPTPSELYAEMAKYLPTLRGV